MPDFMVAAGTTFRLITDQLGSVRQVVNASTGVVAQEITYDPFGEVISDSNPGFQPFGFAGGLYESLTGLTHFGAREYDAGLGRWTSVDPIGFGGGDTNLYGYVVQDPVNLMDPSGFYPWDRHLPDIDLPDIDMPDIDLPDVDIPDWLEPSDEWPFPTPCPTLIAAWDVPSSIARMGHEQDPEVPMACASAAEDCPELDDSTPDDVPESPDGEPPIFPTPSPGWDPKPQPRPNLCWVFLPRPRPVPC